MNVSQTAVVAALSAIDVLMNGGTLVMYSGTQPANEETALSGNTAICTWTFAATAFSTPTVSGGYEVANASFTSASATAAATGNPVTFARAYESNGTTVVQDYTVGTTGTDIILATTNIPSGTVVTLTLADKEAVQ